MRRFLIIFCLTAVFALCFGCESKTDTTAEPTATKPDKQAEPSEATDTAPSADAAVADDAVAEKVVEERALGLDDVRPSWRRLGSSDSTPEGFLLVFPRDLAPSDSIGKALTEGTRISVTPELAGTLKWQSPNELKWTPTSPFAPQTKYLFHLSQLQTRKESFTPPQNGSFVFHYDSPEFQVNWAVLDKVSLIALKRIQVAASFSHPIDEASLKRRLIVEIDGRNMPIRNIQVESDHIVRFMVDATANDAGKHMKLMISSGVLAKGSKVRMSRQYEGTFTIHMVDVIEIQNVRVIEGENGYYVDVECLDKTINPRYTWFYDSSIDEHRRIPINDVCPLDESMFPEYVQIEPKMKLTFSRYNGGFRIFGPFEQGSVQLQIKSGLRGPNAELVRPLSRSLLIPRRTPQTEFVSIGRYVPRSGTKRIPVRHINVNPVELTIRHVPESNVFFWLSAQDERFNDRLSDPLATHSFSVENPIDEKTTSWLDISELLPTGQGGVYELNLAEGKQAARLIITDLGVIVKSFGPKKKKATAWVVNVHSLAPRAGARVMFVRKSGTPLAECTTNSDGTCSAALAEQAYAVAVKTDNDFTVIRPSDNEIAISDTFVQGDPFTMAAPYRAALYPDRGVYRPGDVAHVTAVVRDAKNRAPQKDVPLIAELRDPQQKAVSSSRRSANEAGVIVFDLPFQDYAATGPYTFTLKMADKVIGSLKFNVEEFVPERMRVTVEGESAGVSASTPVEFKATARYLFGADAKNEDAEFACTLREEAPRFKEFADFNFGFWREKPLAPVPLATLKGTTDKNGQAAFVCPPVESAVTLQTPAVVTARATVFEAGSGRSTVNTGDVRVFPADKLVGLDVPKSVSQTEKSIAVRGVIVDTTGRKNRSAAKVDMTVFDLTWEYSWEYDYSLGYGRYTRYARPVPIKQTTIDVSDGSFTFRFENAGSYWRDNNYIVEAKLGNAVTRVMVGESGDDQSWWERYQAARRGDERTPRPENPSHVRIDAPDQIESGEAVTLTVHAPNAGHMLFTIETDALLESRWIKVHEGKNAVDVRVESFAPNVYFSALILKDPHLESQNAFMPDRSFGVVSVPLKPTAHVMPLTLTVPQKVEPNSKLTVTLDVGSQDGPIYATVAAVDEGILQLTKFKSPDLTRLLFMPRKLGVDTFESFGWQWRLPGMSQDGTQGGDATAPAGGRIQMVKPVALFSGLVRVGADGKATVIFDVPTYRGELRVMASIISPTRTVSAAKPVTVADPLVLQATLPRFLINDDRFAIPVMVTNLTGKPEEVVISLKADDGIAIDGDSSKTVGLGVGDNAQVVFTAKAIKAFGATTLTVLAKGRFAQSHDTITVPFLPNGPTTNEMTVVALKPGKTNLTGPLAGWDPQYESTSIALTNSQFGQSLKHLKRLIRYPYGCIEQTTSTTRPLLYIANLVAAADPEFIKNQGIEEKLMHGVNRLFSMQTISGGFSYWPGASEPTYWGTAYVTHLLLDAKAQGYAIDQARIDQALDFMENTLTNHVNDTDRKYGYSVAKSEPYMQYVLARAGRARKARMRALIKSPGDWGQEKAENLFLLKAGLYLAGDRSFEADLKHIDTDVTSKRSTGWTFWSSLRSTCMQLDVQAASVGAGEGLGIASGVASAMGTGDYLTTQEMSWCASALGRRATRGAETFSSPVLKLNGKSYAALPPSGKPTPFSSWLIDGASRYTSMDLLIDSIDGGALYAAISVDGIKPGTTYQYGDNGLWVERTLKTPEGGRVDYDDINLGDLIFIQVTLQNRGYETLQNLVLVDRIPAGFEIENPRLNRGHTMEWIPDSVWNVDYMGIRDHQIELFGQLTRRQEVSYVYAVRAVTAGTFTQPPIDAEAMYDPRIWGREKGRTIIIQDPWQAFLAKKP